MAESVISFEEEESVGVADDFDESPVIDLNVISSLINREEVIRPVQKAYHTKVFIKALCEYAVDNDVTLWRNLFVKKEDNKVKGKGKKTVQAKEIDSEDGELKKLALLMKEVGMKCHFQDADFWLNCQKDPKFVQKYFKLYNLTRALQNSLSHAFDDGDSKEKVFADITCGLLCKLYDPYNHITIQVCFVELKYEGANMRINGKRRLRLCGTTIVEGYVKCRESNESLWRSKLSLEKEEIKGLESQSPYDEFVTDNDKSDDEKGMDNTMNVIFPISIDSEAMMTPMDKLRQSEKELQNLKDEEVHAKRLLSTVQSKISDKENEIVGLKLKVKMQQQNEELIKVFRSKREWVVENPERHLEMALALEDTVSEAIIAENESCDCPEFFNKVYGLYKVVSGKAEYSSIMTEVSAMLKTSSMASDFVSTEPSTSAKYRESSDIFSSKPTTSSGKQSRKNPPRRKRRTVSSTPTASHDREKHSDRIQGSQGDDAIEHNIELEENLNVDTPVTSETQLTIKEIAASVGKAMKTASYQRKMIQTFLNVDNDDDSQRHTSDTENNVDITGESDVEASQNGTTGEIEEIVQRESESDIEASPKKKKPKVDVAFSKAVSSVIGQLDLSASDSDDAAEKILKRIKEKK